MEARVKRLLNYRRPRLKFLLARGLKSVGVLSLFLTAAFLIQFHLKGHHAEVNGDWACLKVFHRVASSPK